MKTIAIQPAHIHCAGCVHLGDYDGKTECMNCVWWKGGAPENAPCYESARQSAPLVDISSQVKSFVADCSRNIRELSERDSRLHSNEKRLLRNAKKLGARSGSFSAVRAKALTERADQIRAVRWRVLQQIGEYARRVVKEAPLVDAMTTLDDRCDLLNVDAADREYLTEKDGIVEIALARLAPDGSFIKQPPARRPA